MSEESEPLNGLTGPALLRIYTGAGPFTPPSRALAGLTAEQAATKHPGAPHSIREIVAHMHFYQEWAVSVAEGRGATIPPSAAIGWPEDADWNSLRDAYLAGVSRVEELSRDEELMARRASFEGAEIIGWDRYTIGFAILDIGVHNAHHLGQIVLLRQLGGVWPPDGGGVTW